MRDGEIIFKTNMLSRSIRRLTNAQYSEAVRLDALIQLLIEKQIFTKDELDARFKIVQEDIQKKMEEAAGKPKLVVMEKPSIIVEK